jgi:hypothetical protein
MADRAAKERNKASKGRTGRLTFKKRKKLGAAVKRTKYKFPDGSWDSPQGIPRPRPRKA